MPPLSPPITSRTNARVKALRASLSGEARRPGDLLGLEGRNLVKEATLAGLRFETVYLRQGDESFAETDGWAEQIEARERVVLSRDVFDSAVTTVSPQGIAATWLIQERALDTASAPSGLILEGLQDPGNLGTLIRSAAAFGVRRIFVTPETVNHWTPKVMRAAAGAVFSVQVERLTLPEIGEQIRSAGARIFAAVSRFSGDGEPEAGDGSAASLVYDTDFADPFCILIGNEGAGLSPEALRLADEQVSIPCNTESLNAAVAGSVLMYEAMRQRTLRIWAQRQGLRP